MAAAECSVNENDYAAMSEYICSDAANKEAAIVAASLLFVKRTSYSP
jgi:hypothetical protein